MGGRILVESFSDKGVGGLQIRSAGRVLSPAGSALYQADGYEVTAGSGIPSGTNRLACFHAPEYAHNCTCDSLTLL
ncbi:protein of unknown function [Kyrpidia spormannii]|uniref:Uncharacterized protein n=2 Tax=Kyrpidia spormannii TaxID=2055160 RepID=A0ACA8Z6X6_9BACL|nr:protein of unknown function [Kyrpidia spormannii]CAB3391559.1 protein of unknown function [Kyrpidia spormannii]